jgi:hypothetical protein
MSVCALEYLGLFRWIMTVQDDFPLPSSVVERGHRQRLMPGHPRVFVSPNGVRSPARLYGAYQEGRLEGKRDYVPLTAIALPELDVNSALCKVDAAQLR